jgi:hypothetical protein
MQFFLRRSESRADLNAAYRILNEGETDHLDFRLTDLQVASLDSDELMLLRNSIFARLGYIFVNDSISEYFLQFHWYHPRSRDVGDDLSDTDLWNIRLIRYYEDRLGENGDGSMQESDLQGFWHGSASVGSGYSERYLLYEDGKFVFRENSMDGSARLEEVSGVWLLDDGHLVLEVDSAVYLDGGEIVEPYASWGSEYVIEGGVRTRTGIEPGLVLRMPIDGYTDNYAKSCGNDEFEHLTVPFMRVGFGDYWRISGDPASLDN